MTPDTISDEQVILEAIRLVGEGLSVTLRVNGRSMLPFIRGGERAVLTRPGAVRRGDVVLARIDGSRYVLHRVLQLSPERVVLMGDGNLRARESCRPDDILARTDEIVGCDGRHRRLDAPLRRFSARLWRWLLPLRRGLLFLYRNLCLRNTPIR